MLIVLLVLGVILIIIGLCIVEDFPIGIGVIMIVISLIFGFFCVDDLVASRDIDERIAMYEEQNTKIEEQVYIAVSEFMEHENKVFENANPDNTISLVSLYPELKSDELISKQVNIYVGNNEKICELKEEKIEVQRAKFWLYFGR